MSSIKFTPPFIAHRGMSSLAPENTLAAFSLVKAHGFKWVEFDVMLTKDKIPVVIHDETLDRTTSGSGNVFDMPLSELAQLDAGSWFGSAFKSETISTLEEVLVFLHRQGLCVNVEVKAEVGRELTEAKAIVSEAKKHWHGSNDEIIFSSFSVPVLNHIRDFLPDANIALLVHDWFDGWEKLAQDVKCISVNVNQEILEQHHVASILKMQKQVLSYTVNDKARADELFSWGVAAVFSDCPHLL